MSPGGMNKDFDLSSFLQMVYSCLFGLLSVTVWFLHISSCLHRICIGNVFAVDKLSRV